MYFFDEMNSSRAADVRYLYRELLRQAQKLRWTDALWYRREVRRRFDALRDEQDSSVLASAYSRGLVLLSHPERLM